MKNKIFIISGCSGAGGDTVIKALKKILPIKVVITTTTRKMRPGESQGNPYYFISKERFKKLIEEKKFFEWTIEDNDNYYGGTFDEIEKVLKSKKIGIWKIDYQGAKKAKTLMPNAIIINISIPMELIKKRLQKREGSTAKFIKSRVDYAKGYFDNKYLYDYIVENKEGKLNETVKEIANIIKSYKVES